MLKTDNSFYHFINFIFAIIVSVAASFFFMQGDRIVTFGRFLEFVSPFAVIILGYLIYKKIQKFNFSTKKEKEKFLDIVLHLTYLDKIKSDTILFALPTSIIVIAIMVQGKIYLVDVLQAVVAFIFFYLWQRWLFRKL